MKTSLVLCFAALLCVSGHAQVFRPEMVNGAVIGGLAGAVIGNNSGDLHHNGARGAAIGAVAGAVIGSAIGESREHSGYHSTQASYRNHSGLRSSISIGVGYGSGGYWGSPYRHRASYGYPVYSYGYSPRYGYGYGYYAPVYSSYYDDDYGSPSRAVSGALLGGIAGAIIGNNSGHGDGLRGAAIGAGAGLLLGSLADSANRDRVVEAVPVYREQAAAAPAPVSAPAASTTPQNVTIINNYYGSNPAPMASANGLFGR